MTEDRQEKLPPGAKRIAHLALELTRKYGHKLVLEDDPSLRRWICMTCQRTLRSIVEGPETNKICTGERQEKNELSCDNEDQLEMVIREALRTANKTCLNTPFSNDEVLEQFVAVVATYLRTAPDDVVVEIIEDLAGQPPNTQVEGIPVEELDIIMNQGDEAVGWPRYSTACNEVRAWLERHKNS